MIAFCKTNSSFHTLLAYVEKSIANISHISKVVLTEVLSILISVLLLGLLLIPDVWKPVCVVVIGNVALL
jgi:hypothetical protein